MRHLTELEGPYDPTWTSDVSAPMLVEYALSVSDYWADRALEWCEQGLGIAGFEAALHEFGLDRRRPQPLRHRARRILKAAGWRPPAAS